jgi:hypothetical protein
MSNYQRVTYHPEGGRKRTILLDVESDGELFLMGTEVTIEGVFKWTKAGTTKTVHMISSDLVDDQVPMVMDLHYGMLVEA